MSEYWQEIIGEKQMEVNNLKEKNEKLVQLLSDMHYAFNQCDNGEDFNSMYLYHFDEIEKILIEP